MKTLSARVARWLGDDVWDILTTLTGLAIVVLGVLVSVTANRWTWLFHTAPAYVLLLLVALNIGGYLGRLRRARRRSSLEEQVHSQQQLVGALSNLNRQQQRLLEQAHHDYRALLEAHLVPLAQELNFKDTERVSVYKHDGQRFLELGRYSKNPDFHKTGRGVYPDNEGCLGRAWREGWAYVADLPDPKTEFNEYCHRQAVEYNISQLAVRGLTMRSLTYAALAIDSLRGDVRVAVIVCESTKPEDFSRDEVSRGFLTAGKGIVYFLEYMRPLEPSLDYANEEGF